MLDSPAKRVKSETKWRMPQRKKKPGETADKPPPKLPEALIILSDPLPLHDRQGAPLAVYHLKGYHCSWPIGDPKEADFHYCSAKRRPGESPPYCREHTETANTKSSHLTKR